jgi:hypothetical protein
MAHRLKNCIVKLDGPRNEQRGVGCLARHVAGNFWLGLHELGLGLLFGEGLWSAALYAVAVGVFEMSGALSRERCIDLEGFWVEVFRKEIKAGVRRCP